LASKIFQGNGIIATYSQPLPVAPFLCISIFAALAIGIYLSDRAHCSTEYRLFRKGVPHSRLRIMYGGTDRARNRIGKGAESVRSTRVPNCPIGLSAGRSGANAPSRPAPTSRSHGPLVHRSLCQRDL
jgi:hypothetical protein